MREFFRVFGAFWRHDAAESASYSLERLALVGRVAAFAVLLWFGRGLIATDRDEVLGDTGFFMWALSGYAGLAVFRAGLVILRERLQRYQLSGMLEACMMTGTPPWRIIAAMPAYDIASTFGMAALVVAAAVPFADSAVSPGGAAIAAAYALGGLIASSGFGMIAGAVVLVTKQRDPVSTGMAVLATVVSGAFVPRSLLPEPLALVGAWIPAGSALDGIRHGLAGGDAGDAWLRLLIVTALVVPLGIFALRVAVRRVMRDGSMAHY
jgi:ABC-2 type transport system permease protein